MPYRSFNKVNARGRKPSGGDSCSPDACGANSRGGVRMGGTKAPNTDVSSGMRRQRSPRRLG